MSKRAVVTCIGAVLAALLATVALLPGGASAVTSTASISGSVLSATNGKPIAGVSVELFENQTIEIFGTQVTGPGFVAATTSAADGTYTLPGLPAADRDGYFVCFDTFGTDLSAYVGQCWADKPGFAPFPDPFGFFQLPFGTSPVHLRAGQQVTGINADLVNPRQITPADSGSIAGTVTRGRSGHGLPGVVVDAINGNNRIFGQAVTAADGTYEIDNLPAVPVGYQVCFDTDKNHGAFPPGRFASRCFDGVAWTGGRPPSTATRVRVRHGATTSGVDAALPR
jgi:hypothetical protein